MTVIASRPTEDRRAARRLSRPGVALLASGPVLIMAAELISPPWPDDAAPAAKASFVIGHADQLLPAYLLSLVGGALLAAAFVRGPGLLGSRGQVLARIAAWLGAAGAAGLVAYEGTSILALDVLQADAAAAEAIHQAYLTGLVFPLLMAPMIIGVPVSLLLLAIAALRSGAVRGWVVVVAAVALVSDYVPIGYATDLFAALAAVVLTAIGLGIVRQDAADQPDPGAGN
jgi:hypothetical protein